MMGDAKDAAVSAEKELVVELGTDARDIIVPVSHDDKVILNFPLSGVTSRTEGNALVLECPGGQCIYLPGAMESNGVVILADGRILNVGELIDLLTQNQEEEPAADAPQEVAAEGEGETKNEEERETEGQQSESDSSGTHKSDIVLGGEHTYADDAGNPIDSIDRFGDLGRTFWSPGQEGERTALGLRQEGSPRLKADAPLPDNVDDHTNPPPDEEPKPLFMDVSLSTGPQHLSEYMVLESDPDGAFIHMQLNAAPEAALPLVLGISGTAAMGVDYADPSQWLVIMSDGSEVPGLIKSLGNGQVSFDIPAGSMMMGFRVPVMANDSIDPDRTFTYTVLKSGGYMVRSGLTGTVTIVDDAHAQDHGWTPPAPGDPAYSDPHQAGPKTAYARIVLTDGTDVQTGTDGQPLRSSEIIENSAGDVHYRFQLLNAADGQDYTLREANLFTVKLTGAHGLALGSDYDFDFTNIGLIDPAYNYNPATGLLTFTLPQGWNGSIDFTGHPHADYLIESGTPRENIAVEITGITPLAGTEIIIHGPDVATDIIDIPTAYVATNVNEIFESAGRTGMPNSVDFTFKLTSAAPQATTVQLNWDHLDAGLNTGDYTYTINGVTYGPNQALPTSITFPAGSTSVVIKVTAYDDKLTENIERLKVTILPEDTATDNAGDNYHVADGTGGLNNNATISIIDDADPLRGGSGAYNDGPLVQLILTDAGGNPLSNTAATTIMENGGKVYYQVQLVDRVTKAEYHADQDVTVKLKAVGLDGAELTGADTDYGFTLPILPGFNYNPATGELSVVINQGDSHVRFTGESVTDALQEGREQVKLDITSTEGNETSIDPGHKTATASIMDSPTVSVAVDHADIFESSGNPALPYNEADFTFSLNAAVPQDTVLKLNWEHLDAGLSTTDYKFIINGTTYGPGSGLPSTITVPANTSSVTVKVIAVDDHLSEGLERLKVTILPQNGANYQPGDDYAVTDGSDGLSGNAATAIHDDTDAAYGNSGQYLDGPYVKLILTDAAGTPLSDTAATSIMENGGKVYYQVQLVDRGTGQTYTALQDVKVTLKAEGLSTDALLDGANKDYGFANGTGAGYSYNPATGIISITVPTGASSVKFTGTAIGDNRVEGNEQFKVSVTGTEGNESSVHPTQSATTATVVEVPSVSVRVDNEQIYESDAPGNTLGENGTFLSNAATFTFTLSSTSLNPVTVPLDWATGTTTPGLTTGDYKYIVTINGVSTPYGPNQALPTSITFPAGQSSLAIKVIAVDDAHSEGPETLRVTLRPESGTAYNEAHGYYVDPAPGKGTAATTIIDDTAISGQPHIDGPVVALYVVDNGAAVDTRTASVWEDDPVHVGTGGAPTKEITYRLQLENANGTAHAGAGEAITVTLNLTGSGGMEGLMGPAQYGASGDFYLGDIPAAYSPSFNAGTNTLTLVLPAGAKFVDIPVKIVSDRFTETGRVKYLTDEHGDYIPDPQNPDDFLYEEIDDEGFTISIGSTSGNESSIHTTKNHVDTNILEEFIDTQVEILKTHTGSVAEGQSASYQVKLSQVATEDVYVYVRVSSNNPEDIDGGLFEVKIPAGSLFANFNVPIFNDTFTEGTEDYTLEILRVRGGEAIINQESKSATGYIHDDMNGPVVQITGETTVQESPAAGDPCRQATYTISLGSRPGDPAANAIPSEEMTITLKLEQTGANKANVSGADADVAWPDASAFSLPPGFSVAINGTEAEITVPPGFTGGSFEVKVNIIDDAYSEDPEYYHVRVSNVSGSEATIGAGDRAETEIIDDTDARSTGQLDGPFVYLSGELMVSEACGEAVYTLTLRDANGNLIDERDIKEDIVVKIKYTDGPDGTAKDVLNPSGNYAYGKALSSKDYTELPENTTVTIKAGHNSTTFKVPIANDALSESNERFTVSIDSVAGHEARLPSNPADKSVVTTIVDNTDYRFNDGTYNHADGATLNGPIVSMVGSASVRESDIQANATGHYQVKLSMSGEEDVIVTIKFQGNGSASAEDMDLAALLANSPVDGQGNKLISNIVFPNPNDDTVFTFDVRIPKGRVSFDLSLPIVQDHLSEEGESFTLTLDSARGAEAQILSNNPSYPTRVDTELLDDGSGPSISIDVDADFTSGVNWRNLAEVKLDDIDPAEGTAFRVLLDGGRTAAEPIEVLVRLFGQNGATITGDKVISGATYDPTTECYKVIVPKGGTGAVFNLDLDSTGRYYMEIKSVHGSESSINDGDNLVETYIYTGGSGPSNYTYIRLTDLDCDADYPNTVARVGEGSDAHYRLFLSNGNNDYTKNIQAAFTLAPKNGTDITFGDFDFLNPAKFNVTNNGAGGVWEGAGIGAYTGLSFKYDGTAIVIWVNIPGNGTRTIDFNIPIKADGVVEGDNPIGRETFAIVASQANTQGVEVAFTGTTQYDKHIEDDLSTPTITIEPFTPGSNAMEGGTYTYRIKLDKVSDVDTVVELGFGKSGDTATANEDYVPYVLPVTIAKGELTATVTINLPNDEYWEGDEQFSVWVKNIIEGRGVIGTNESNPLTTIIEEDLNGPTASFAVNTMSQGEDVGNVQLHLVFNRPAVEDSWITIKVAGKDAGTEYGKDFTFADSGLTKLSAPPAGGYTKAFLTDLGDSGEKLCWYTDGVNYYLIAKMEQSDVLSVLEIQGFLKDNHLTGGDKGVVFSIVDARGGEVSISNAPGKDRAALTIEDVDNGPYVNVSADKTTIHEDPSRTTDPFDANANKVTFTISLTDPDTGQPYSAEEIVTITYHFESALGSGHPLPAGVTSGPQTAMVGVGDDLVTIPVTLGNDRIDQPNGHGLRLVIDSVSGNESRKGTNASSTVAIVDDDHTPEAVDDTVLFLVPPTPGTAYSVNMNVLYNDTDKDPYDISEGNLRVALPTGWQSDSRYADLGGGSFSYKGKYGTYVVDALGNVTYTLDPTAAAVSSLTLGQTIGELPFSFRVTDGVNSTPSAMNVNIRAGTNAGDISTTGADIIFGTSGNDTIDGKGGADIIHGMAGNDTLIDVDGKAILHGDEGDDVFVVKDIKSTGTIEPKNFSEIHGGAGVDTIQVSGAGKTLDMRANAWTGAKVIDSIEILDISSGNNLYLDSFGVNKLNTSRPAGDETPDHPLRIIGAAGSTFEFPNTGEGWQCLDPTNPANIVTDDKGRTFYTFKDSANNTVLVQTTLTQVIHGTSGDDAFTAQDRLITYYGQGGDDVIHVGSGKNTLYGEAGSDTFILGDGASGATFNKDSFAKIDGGAGTDTLKLNGTNNILNLTGITAGKLAGIEVIDIKGGGGNSIVLDAALLTNDTGREGDGALTINGNAGDYYELTGAGWTYTGVADGYSVYTNGAQTLKVQADMVRVQSTSGGTLTNEQTSDYLKGGAGNDTFALKDLTADNKITGNDFGKIAGGGGTDKLTIAAGAGNDNLGIDLTGLAAGKISGISTIDLAAHGANHLKLDADTLTQMGATTLTVNGDASDTYELAGTGWVYQSTSGGYHQYQDAGGKILKVQTSLVRVQNADAGGSTLTGDVATDKLLGGAGNDIFALKDVSGDGKISGADFGSINGGAGANTLTFAAAANGLNIDLSALGASKISNVSTIDLTGHGNNRLVLGNATIADMGLTTLTVNGEAGDSYELTGAGWVYSNTTGGYHIYTNGAQSLHVQDTLTRVQQTPAAGGALTADLATDQLLGGAGDDTFALKDLTGDSVLSKADFGTISGGAGSNTLAFASAAGNGLGVDLTGLGAGKISGIGVIDLTGHGANRLTLDAASLSDMGAASLDVKGESGDTYELAGSGWSYASTGGGYHTYTNGGRTLRVQDTLARVQQAPAVGGTLTNILATDQLLGGPGSDIFALVDVSGDGKISGADFGLINGGAGSNTLTFASGSQHDDLDMDFTALSAGKISGINAIDLTGHGGNHLDLDGNTIQNMGVGVDGLHVNGDASDTFTLNGAGWTYADTAGGYHEYTDANGKSLYVAEDMSRVIQAGNTGETLTAEHGNTQLLGGAGNDTLEATAAGSGQHYLHGGAGDDILRVGDTVGGDSIINSADFSGLHGGSGNNTLEVGDGLTFDLTSFTAGKVDGIQHVVLGANSTLKLDAASLHSMLDDGVSNDLSLLLDGDAGSKWDKGSATWTDNGTRTIDSVTYSDYSIDHDSVTLHVLLKSGVGIA